MRSTFTHLGTRSLAIAVIATGTLLAGCKAKETPADTTAAGEVAKPAADSIAAMTTPAPGTTVNAGWTDGQILAFAEAASRGEIEEGKLASKKASNPAVKAFARQMVKDHEAMLKETTAFATKGSIMLDTTKSDVTDLAKDAKSGVDELTTKAPGADWDANFMDKEISGHKAVLTKLQDAEKATTNADLKAMLNKAVGKVQSHLTKAEDVRQNQPKA
ncbi:MAG TPA: DUF4142 domain-containing protein [Gemmatimonadaceae bacterium]|nr:DUF4142 domain-containing protein [Gemmatimonadaceae bacterium]